MDMTGFQVRVIVIDNDHRASAGVVVDRYRVTKTPFSIFYDVEPIQGISYARNRALRHIDADYAAFLDDDETVSSGWLQSMMHALHHYGADVVFGPVIGLLPEGAPKWSSKHPSFKRPRHSSGAILATGATGNVLFRVFAIGQPRQQFNSAYALTGGEDTDYFSLLHRSGVRMIWCDEGEVFESISEERLNIKWICRRGYRGGQQFYKRVVQSYSAPNKFLWFSIKIAQTITASLFLPIIAIVSFSQAVIILTRISASMGQLSMSIGMSCYQEYRPDRYRTGSE
ncbi:glycosyl transferase family 2 [Thiorhodococcus drewsii AZ1]|uniref:Glycosyl transferase family 2 n=2 Tax=Thiorhodococcus drewsii TaxID=210408 RepID=G2E3Q6_9GAMM|nr:glycosyl transferase family 2 [Thiorhodococcus drewsii AZ1]